MPSDEGRYAIGDLAGMAGATPRTVRYYVAQGLLPAPVGAGPGAHYTDAHLARLRLIRRLQRQHQPLAEIRRRLASLGEADVAAFLAEDESPEPAPADSALDYIRSILGTPVRPASPPVRPTSPPAAAAPPMATATASAPMPARLLRSFGMPRMRDVPASPPAPHGSAPAAPVEPSVPTPVGAAIAAGVGEAVVAGYEPDAPSSEQRSQWDRIGLTPNIEIHVRRPLSRLENRRVERLITIARQVLREEQP